MGKTAYINCIASGIPLTEIKWLHNGHPLSFGARVRLITNSSILINPITKDDKGMYQCLMSNQYDYAQGICELRLGEVQPQFNYKFIEHLMQPNTIASLKCIASGNPTPHILWNVDGYDIKTSERILLGQYVTLNGDVVSHVNITGLTTEDSGDYECTAISKAGNITHINRLSVYGKPLIRYMPTIIAIAGNKLLIKCPIGGYPIDGIKWLKDNITLPNDI